MRYYVQIGEAICYSDRWVRLWLGFEAMQEDLPRASTELANRTRITPGLEWQRTDTVM